MRPRTYHYREHFANGGGGGYTERDLHEMRNRMWDNRSYRDAIMHMDTMPMPALDSADALPEWLGAYDQGAWWIIDGQVYLWTGNQYLTFPYPGSTDYLTDDELDESVTEPVNASNHVVCERGYALGFWLGSLIRRYLLGVLSVIHKRRH